MVLPHCLVNPFHPLPIGGEPTLFRMLEQVRNRRRGKVAEVDHPECLAKTELPFGCSSVPLLPPLCCEPKRFSRASGIERATSLEGAEIVTSNEI